MKYTLGITVAAVLSFASLPSYALDWSSVDLVAVKKAIASGQINLSTIQSQLQGVDTTALQASLVNAGVNLNQVKTALQTGDVGTLQSIYNSIPEDQLAEIIDKVEDLPITP